MSFGEGGGEEVDRRVVLYQLSWWPHALNFETIIYFLFFIYFLLFYFMLLIRVPHRLYQRLTASAVPHSPPVSMVSLPSVPVSGFSGGGRDAGPRPKGARVGSKGAA